MISDPLTVPAVTLVFNGSTPVANGNSCASRVFNTISLSGRSTVRNMQISDLGPLNLSKASISVSHQTTNQGRVRSVFRIDATSLADESDATPRSASAYLVIDKEAIATANSNGTSADCLAILAMLLFGASGANALTTTSVCTEFLNGEP